MAVAAFEALARFRTEPRQRPDRWFREAAEVGLGTRLELTAVRAALDHLPDLPAQARLSINVSPATATGAGIRAALASARADRVILELTEHVRVTAYRALDRSLRELRSRGVRLAIDDVGAGFANLRHVVRLRPDMIKLDVGLVQGVDTDPFKRALASALASFAGEIGASLVAEGISTPGQLEAVRALGVGFGQGFLLAPPGPLPEATAVP
jgi:EAL domain-containing protein (putative c-di-GMP-specific phosphodiesterase class I)